MNKGKIRECAVLSILLPNNTIYEKHLFSNREIWRWQEAMMFIPAQIINIEKRLVWEGEE